MISDYYLIGRVPVAITDYDRTEDMIRSVIKDGHKGYICVSNMRTVTTANKDDKYYETMQHSLLNLPDGTPLVWCGRFWGLKEVKRVCGPVLFERMLADKDHCFRHFFLGDTEETLAALTQKVIFKLRAVSWLKNLLPRYIRFKLQKRHHIPDFKKFLSKCEKYGVVLKDELRYP